VQSKKTLWNKENTSFSLFSSKGLFGTWLENLGEIFHE
jgi:hypothetical protein